MTLTTYSPRVTRDGSDFLAECVEWDGNQEVNVIFVGWFDTHELARAAANEEVTDCYTRDANAQLEQRADDRDAEIARRELAADAAHERAMLTERLVQAGALTAADHLAAGATWEYDGAAVVVQRPGGEQHRVVRGRCSCSASRFGRACWALDVVAELVPAARVAA